ncbi:50S ribosomal protein L4 [Desulfosoma caldarium]|uniref:Large ribosomal subunit protein uL4 n=1 Tax=Desulfosoma caldarium TaxID=610254 RepID=A0A3N1VFX1_9BACT|nr:50S ribosomal protein L4 [Desulfosoma caldarium]ROR01734.1 LSU ribosomal protein L4P [Desulfosoma caldarium]
MPTVDIFDMNRQVVGQLDLRDDIFNVPAKSHVVHHVVLYQLAKRRRGTAKTKGRSEVSGGGKKPWRQKGTGRARAGTTRSPLWRGGGTVHGPQPRTYNLKVPKKVRRLALKMVLSQKLRDQALVVVDQLQFPEIKTKHFHAWMHRFALQKPLVVLAGKDEIVEKSARNIPDVKVLRSEGLNVFDMLKHGNLVLTKDTVSKIEESLG